MTAEVRRSPTPRFSDEAYAHAAGNIARVLASAAMTDSDAVIAADAANIALGSVEVAAEFDAACLSAWRSGQETARRDLAERLRERAAAQGKSQPYAGAGHLCTENTHDDRYCMDCDRMSGGLLLAADLIEQWSEEGSGVPAPTQEGTR